MKPHIDEANMEMHGTSALVLIGVWKLTSLGIFTEQFLHFEDLETRPIITIML
jgi:hypothetical protein